MELDQGNPSQPEKPKPASGLWQLWLLLGIVPVPIGLLIGPINVFNSVQGPNRSLLVRYTVVTAILSLICGIGLCAGFRSRKMENQAVRILAGVLVGFAIAGINLFVVFFVGCASAFSHI